MLWNIELLVYGVPYMPHMTKMDSLVSESIEALDAIGKKSTVFFILYVHKMYSPSLGIKLQEEVTLFQLYIREIRTQIVYSINGLNTTNSHKAYYKL